MPGHFIIKCCTLLLYLLLPQSAQLLAQYTVTIQLDRVPSSHANDPVFIAGSFNGWSPAAAKYKLIREGWVQVVVLQNLSANDYEFKFTRGSWDKVACAANGAEMPNQVIHISGDTTIICNVPAWKDDFAGVVIKSTASPQVRLLNEVFHIPQLNRDRSIWIYLPENYEQSKQRYPVLYMQDGQNLFDASLAANGEWRVDELLDSLIAGGAPPCIVIGIANGGNYRMSEYNPYPFSLNDSVETQSFLAEGDAYIGFLSQTLKPYIDQHYRTLPSKKYSIVAGSSMGGVISFYAALKLPEVFGKAGIFSPAFWTAPQLAAVADSIGSAMNGKYFFYMGDKEGARHKAIMEQMTDKIGRISSAMIYCVLDPEGKHNEAAWQKWFVEFYKWVLADGYNVITNISD